MLGAYDPKQNDATRGHFEEEKSSSARYCGPRQNPKIGHKYGNDES
jgi:hypothetical protein